MMVNDDRDVEEVKEKFKDFSEAEKIQFIKTIMPEIRNLVEENPDFMQEMMQMLIEKIDKDKIDAFQMIDMMGKIM